MHSTMQDEPLTIASILRFGASVFGDATVFSARPGGTPVRRTYLEIAERTQRLASALRGLGVSGDQRVATLMWNNVEHLEAYLAVPSMGAVLHTVNVRLSPEQITYIVNHAEDQVIIADGSLLPTLAGLLGSMPTVRAVIVTGDSDLSAVEAAGKQVLDYEEVLAASAGVFDWPRDLDERSAAAMCYTSGTTGRPKGVVYSHRSCWLHAVSTLTANNNGGLSWHHRPKPGVPMFHANAWGMPYAAFSAGAGLVMPDRDLTARHLVGLIESERVTVSAAVPTIWNDVLQYLRKNPGRDMSSLRTVLCGGSAVPQALIEAFETEFGVTMVQGWGMTETSPVAAVALPPLGATGERAIAYRSMTGRQLFGVQARIVGDAGTELARNGRSVGELEVRGPWVTGSYYRDSESENSFRDGWLRTGDVGTIDPQGYIMLTDRSKDVIKSGGEWISSVELEGHLMSHPAVLEAVVVGVPDDRWQERPLAAVVIKPGEAVTAEDLVEHLRPRVARWWLPERWAFVDQVPKTSVGKFDKKMVRREYADGLFDVSVVGQR
jgi:fatty-acyl-CoA synthase